MNSKTLKNLSNITALIMMTIFLSNTGLSARAASNVTAGSSVNSAFTQLNLYPNIETAGVVVSGVNLPKTAQMMYRQSWESGWHAGHPLVRIDDGRLVSSLFGLSASTSYDLRVLDGATEIDGSTTTQANELQFVSSIILHVSVN